MPRTTTSGDDAVVGTRVPSTTADLSKGNGTTQPASSSNASDARNAGGSAMVIRPPPKFGVKKLAIKRVPT